MRDSVLCTFVSLEFRYRLTENSPVDSAKGLGSFSIHHDGHSVRLSFTNFDLESRSLRMLEDRLSIDLEEFHSSSVPRKIVSLLQTGSAQILQKITIFLQKADVLGQRCNITNSMDERVLSMFADPDANCGNNRDASTAKCFHTDQRKSFLQARKN